jgi:dTDP-4-amino-4,6-dideoxygalactose transaminase
MDILRIPVMKPLLATFEEVSPLLQRIDQSKIYSNRGPLVRELEESYSEYFNVHKDLVVALSNATQALQGLVSLSKNQNWIVPDYTFSATGLAVLNAGKNLHICDVNPINWKIDVDLIQERHKSFGLIPVMPFGSGVDFDSYKKFADVIIDAAASLGSIPPIFSQMPSGWAVVYSLHATKVLGAGEGAIVVCGNYSQAESLRAWSNFGFASGRTSEIQGSNAKMSEMNAAYGLHSIQNVSVEKVEWLKSQEYVASHTSQCVWATFVNSTPQFHPYWISSFDNEEEKEEVVKSLNVAGIQSREWWAKPLSTQKVFSKARILSTNEVAQNLAKTHLGLPMYRGLDFDSVSEICDVIHSAFK